MKKIVFSSFNFAPTFLGPTFEMIQSSVNEGHEVHYITCLKSFDSCGFNTTKLKYMCDLCCYRFEKAAKLTTGSFSVKKMNELFENDDFNEAERFINGCDSISMDLFYERFDVGASVLSSYISKTRDKNLELDSNKSILSHLAKQSIIVYLSVKRFLKENSIEEVMLFNGRWDYYRAVFRAANELGIPCVIFENLRPGGFIEIFDNSFPHIIDNYKNRFEDTWHNSAGSVDEKQSIAKEYFERKSRGEAVIHKAFSQNQLPDFLPPGINTEKKVIVIFNSSDDEIAAIGGSEYANPFFEDQAQGILYVAELIGRHMPDFQLVVRMHPNLTGLEFSYLDPLYDLKGKYKNVFIVEPQSVVDSYKLISIADKVITFGSSIGVEATYWGKPVILLSKAFYFKSQIAHIPSDKEEIRSLLESHLDPMPRLGAEKIAFYLMKGGIKASFFYSNAKKEFFFKNFRIDTIPFLKKNYWRLLKRLHIRNGAIKGIR